MAKAKTLKEHLLKGIEEAQGHVFEYAARTLVEKDVAKAGRLLNQMIGWEDIHKKLSDELAALLRAEKFTAEMSQAKPDIGGDE